MKTTTNEHTNQQETIISTDTRRGKLVELKKIQEFNHLIYIAINGCNVGFIGDPEHNQYMTPEKLEAEIDRLVEFYQTHPTFYEEQRALHDKLMAQAEGIRSRAGLNRGAIPSRVEAVRKMMIGRADALEVKARGLKF